MYVGSFQIVYMSIIMCTKTVELPFFHRRPRLKTAGRPASFHGTVSIGEGDSSLPRPRTLRPPRQPSITDEDVEPVAIDGNAYRHMVQDLTTFKTNLLRLKRIIQEVGDDDEY